VWITLALSDDNDQGDGRDFRGSAIGSRRAGPGGPRRTHPGSRRRRALRALAGPTSWLTLATTNRDGRDSAEDLGGGVGKDDCDYMIVPDMESPELPWVSETPSRI
jgi:hypothetical protein